MLGRAAVAFVAVTLGLTVLVASSNDVSVDRAYPASVADDTPSSPTTVSQTPEIVVPTGSGAGDLYAAPVAANVAIGGDQPTGPADVEGGDRPENSGTDADLLLLRDQLRGAITTYQSQVGGIDVAVAVTDLQTGETISIGGNNPQRTGCTINMFALFAVVDRFQSGQANPEAVSANIASGIGGSFPPQVRVFLESVYGSYDVGLNRAREMMVEWGMEVSDFDHVPYYGGSDPAPNILTPLETNDILVRLWRGELFDEEWTAYTLTKLREIASYVNYILPGQLPSAATVAHKIGYYWDFDGWVNNDAGIVTFTGEDGGERAYVITYMSEKARTERIGYSFGAKLSRDVWDWFAAKYGAENNAAPAWSPPPTYEPVVTVAPTAQPAPSSTPTPDPSSTPQPSVTPSPTVTPSPQATPVITATSEPTEAPTPSPEISPEPTATSVPSDNRR
ncbi:MAG: serine hydrolase [Chloroflexi bacterium]|nr:serine hydrolase [Chloroflexota bacterium]